VAWADNLVTVTSENSTAREENRRQFAATATNLQERALADYNRTLAWVDRFPAIARESRRPFVEKRREVLVKLGRLNEAETDERELKDGGRR
jgi:hypothetical protein